MTSRRCPVCFGEGKIDCRDANAVLREQSTDEEVVRFNLTEDFLHCEECEGTGVVTEERYRDLMAAASAYVQQVLAHVAEHGTG